MPAPIRILIPLDSQTADAWALAAGLADAMAAQSPDVREVILLTHTKSQLKDTGLAAYVGNGATKALLANKSVPFPSGTPLRHETLQTLRWPRGAILICYYAEDRMLETVDGLDGLVGVIVVPDFPDQVTKWVARWNPAVPGQPAKAAAPLITDAVTEAALTGLTKWINLGHAILNPRDKAHVDETLRILRAKGHKFEPEMLKSWAIQNGWKPGAADELAKLATRVGALKSKPSLANYHDPDGRYRRWSASDGEA